MRRKPDLRENERDKIISFLASEPCLVHRKEAKMDPPVIAKSPVRIFPEPSKQADLPAHNF